MSVAVIYANMRAEILENAPASAWQAPDLLALLRSDGSFSDLNYQGNSDASASDYRVHGWRLSTLGQTYHFSDPANPLHFDATLKSRILQAFDYIANKAPTVSGASWWWREIGLPNAFNDGLLIMRDELSSTLKSRMLSKFYGSAWSISDDDGANLTYHAPAALTQGVLKNDAYRIKDVIKRVSVELSAYKGEGILQDLSFYQHGGKLNWHSGSYGMVFARDVAQVMRWTAGSDYAFGTAAVDQHLRYVLDHLAWMNRGKLLEPTSQGRSITRADNIGEKARNIRGIVLDMQPLGRRADELGEFLDRVDNGVNADNALSGNKSLWRVDGTLHQREDFFAAVRMLSSRTLRPETADGQNAKGYFEGDGFTVLLKDGDEYGAPGGPQLFDAWDWQLIPGATIEHNGIVPYYNMFAGGGSVTGLSALVGSASDGNYGVAMMDYRRGGVSVTARKSWFFFDGEMVALGADIDAANAVAPVFTTLNQVLLDGPITAADGSGIPSTLALGDSLSLASAQWAHHDGMGYVFLQPPGEATVQAALRTTSSGLAMPVFSTWINHGPALADGSYAYAVVADKTAEEVAAWHQSQPLQILSNTAGLQAVRHDGLAQTQIAFYSAGTLQISPELSVTVDQPVLLILKERGDELEITVADPRKTLISVNVEVTRPVVGPGSSWIAERSATRITFPLPAGGYAGSSVTGTFVETAGPPTMLFASHDASVRGGTYASKNYGQAAQLGVERLSSTSVRESYLQFDLGNLPGEVAFATLKLARVAGTSSVKVDLSPVTADDWSENTLTFSTRPAAEAKIATLTSLPAKPLLFEITALVTQAAQQDGKLSLRLSAGSSSAPLAGFGADESTIAGQRPVLEIHFKKPPPEPVVLPEGEAVELLAGPDLDLLAANFVLFYGPLPPRDSIAKLPPLAEPLPTNPLSPAILVPVGAQPITTSVPPANNFRGKSSRWQLDEHDVDRWLADEFS